jgi:hypothetical protein
VLALVDIDGLSYAEIVRLPTDTVMSRVHRAHKQIHQHLHRVSVDVRSRQFGTDRKTRLHVRTDNPRRTSHENHKL